MDDIKLSNAEFVHRICLRYVQNRDEANDLTQEVLIKMACKTQEFSGESRLGTWLYRVASNCCLDHLRRERRLRGQAETYAASKWGEIRGEESTEPDLLESARSRKVLDRLKLGSGETDRHVIYLRFEIGLSQAGIAEILGVTRAAVAQRLRRIHTRAALLWEEV